MNHAAGWCRMLAALLAVLAGPTASLAQDTDAPFALAAACGEDGGEALARRCADAALAAVAIQEGIGLLIGTGGAFPASPSTAGHRTAGSPRIVLDGGISFASFRHPDLRESDPNGGAREVRTTPWAVRLTGAAGLFEGFSVAPTVGGIGSLDLVGALRILALPSGRGIRGSSTILGAGVRLGLLRESFSLPGVTLTGMYHRVGTIRHGRLQRDGARTSVRPGLTSVRLEAGKELWPLGVVAGVGLDRTGGRAAVAARAEGVDGSSPPMQMDRTRRYLFAGVNYTRLVTQIAAEFAWSPGSSVDPALTGTGPHRPGGSGLQGTVTFRLLY